MRAKTSAPFLTQRELLHHLARYAPNGKSLHQLAADLGQDYTQFNNALSGQERARFDVDLAVPTVHAAGGRVMAGEWNAAAYGGAFVDLEKVGAALRRAWKEGRVQDVALLGLEATREFGDVAGKLAAALGDGRIKPHEADDLDREIQQAVQALLVLRLTIEQARGKGEEG